MNDNLSEAGRYSLKFRAWDRDNSTLYTWTCFDDYPLKDKNATFPQESTGYRDKNDIEIYVGDVINFREKNTLVRFYNGSYVLWIIEPKSTLDLFWFHTVKDNTNEMEIIGNTFTASEYLTYYLITNPKENENNLFEQ